MAHTINQQVVNFAHARVGQQVGRGECWDLADAALRNAGAKSSADLGPMGSNADYVWGDAIDLNAVHAGDILQFRDYTETTTITIDVKFADGSESVDTKFVTIERPHHTAVVETVLGFGLLRVLEQNVDPLGKKVQRSDLPTTGSSPPPTTSHRVMADGTGKKRMATVVEKKVVEVTGTITAYHPRSN